MKKIVIMTEKRNVAKAIAEAINIDTVKLNENGFFEGEKGMEKWVVTYSNGHCLDVKEPEQIDESYKVWKLENLPINYELDKEYMAEKRDKKGLFIKIRKELRSATKIINAGDSGREGELIQREIIDKSTMDGKLSSRAWFHALTKDSIIKVLNDLIERENYKEWKALDNLYEAGKVRAFLDAYMGFNYSRALSLAQSEGKTITYGRCQSPLLNMICTRDEEIKNFKSKDYWWIKAHIKYKDKEYEGYLVETKGKRWEFEDENEGKTILNSLNSKGEVSSIEETEKKESPPRPFDILNLQKTASKEFQFEADETLNICQSLYDTHHILSYPRTDSRYLSSELVDEVKDIARTLNFTPYDSYIDITSFKILDRYFNDAKVTDHHGIIPVKAEKDTEKIYREDLNDKELKIFDLVIKNFISLALGDYVYLQSKVHISIGNEIIEINGRRDIEKGFMKISSKDNKSQDLSGFKEGDEIEISYELIKDKTKPKEYYTTSSLLDLMKLYNIGTGATRDSIIKDLTKKRGKNQMPYVTKKGQAFIPTSFGIEVNNHIPDKLKDIKRVSEIDTNLLRIEKGELDPKEYFKQIKNETEGNINEIKKNAGDKIKKNSDKKVVDIKCPLCHNNLVERDNFYGCSKYAETGCKFTISKSFRNKKLSEAQIKELVTYGKIKKKLKGFKANSGNSYEGYVFLIKKRDKLSTEFSFNEPKDYWKK